jgi:hypothetical protein
MFVRLLHVTVWLCVLLGGCSEDGDDGAAAGDGGAGGGQQLTPCAAHVAWVERCQGEADFSYTTEWGENECPLLPWRHFEPAFIEADVACLETLACSELDDACTEAGFEALGFQDETDIPDDPIYQICYERADACPELIEDACGSLIAFTAEGRDAVRDCFGLACEEIRDCMRNPR